MWPETRMQSIGLISVSMCEKEKKPLALLGDPSPVTLRLVDLSQSDRTAGSCKVVAKCCSNSPHDKP